MELNLTPNNITGLRPPYLLQMKDIDKQPGVYHLDVILNEDGSGVELGDTFQIQSQKYQITELVQGPRLAKGNYTDIKPMWARYICSPFEQDKKETA